MQQNFIGKIYTKETNTNKKKETIFSIAEEVIKLLVHLCVLTA